MRRPEPPNTGPQGLLQRATMPFARLFNDFLFCFTTCNLPRVLVNSIYFFLLLLVLWMLLWALISFAGSPKRCFSLSQRGIPADYSVCHSVLQFIAILGFILSHTWSQASFIPFSGISRMEEVAINRRKDVMPAGWVMSEFIMLKFQRLALVLDLAFSVQGTEQRYSMGDVPLPHHLSTKDVSLFVHPSSTLGSRACFGRGSLSGIDCAGQKADWRGEGKEACRQAMYLVFLREWAAFYYFWDNKLCESNWECSMSCSGFFLLHWQTSLLIIYHKLSRNTISKLCLSDNKCLLNVHT